MAIKHCLFLLKRDQTLPHIYSRKYTQWRHTIIFYIAFFVYWTFMTSTQQWTRMGVWMPNCHNLLGLILPSPVVIHPSSRSSPAVFVNNLTAVKIMIIINTKQYVKCSKKSNVSDSRWTQPSRSLLSPRHTKCKWRWRCLSVCMFVCLFVCLSPETLSDSGGGLLRRPLTCYIGMQ